MTLCVAVSHQAFTSDFRIHWAQHPLRPEFLESTYFLYKVSASLSPYVPIFSSAYVR